MKKKSQGIGLVLVWMLACSGHAELVSNGAVPLETTSAEVIPPLTQLEVQQAMQVMQSRLDARIKSFGYKLTQDDFEWTWTGRQLKQAKRQEVCGIFQGMVDETYQLAYSNKARLKASDEAILENRQLFIEKLGFSHNLVDTQMGFNCRIR